MRITLALVLLAAIARADDYPRLEVEVGKTVELDVGYARGWMCDDPSLVQGSLVTRGDHNVWRVTGAKVGQTLCRVGTDPYAPAKVVEVHVVGKHR